VNRSYNPNKGQEEIVGQEIRSPIGRPADALIEHGVYSFLKKID
jgi:hypothetical protein